MISKLDTPVILARDYGLLVSWYKEIFSFDIADEITEGFRYTTFSSTDTKVLSIAIAEEMGVTPSSETNNTLVPQFLINDISSLLQKVESSGGKILFGPKGKGALYGGFLDIEGNQIWVTEDKNL